MHRTDAYSFTRPDDKRMAKSLQADAYSGPLGEVIVGSGRRPCAAERSSAPTRLVEGTRALLSRLARMAQSNSTNLLTAGASVMPSRGPACSSCHCMAAMTPASSMTIQS